FPVFGAFGSECRCCFRPAGGSQIISTDLLSNKTPAPIQKVLVPVLIGRVHRGIVQGPQPTEGSRERLVRIAAIIPAPAILPPIVVKVVSIPDPVNERLVTDSRAVEIVAAHIVVRDAVSTISQVDLRLRLSGF